MVGLAAAQPLTNKAAGAALLDPLVWVETAGVHLAQQIVLVQPVVAAAQTAGLPLAGVMLLVQRLRGPEVVVIVARVAEQPGLLQLMLETEQTAGVAEGVKTP
jgi:hypothetical protein